MEKLFNILSFTFVIFMLYFQACRSIPQSEIPVDCEMLTKFTSSISYNSNESPSNATKCWIKRIPENSLMVVKFEALSFPDGENQECADGSLEISQWTPDEMSSNRTFYCYSFVPDPFVTFKDVMIKVLSWNNMDFKMKIWTESLLCHDERRQFHCDKYFCIPADKVCDGIIDCENELDERICDHRIQSVEGIRESRLAAFHWLEENSNSSAWKSNLHRTIVALHLSGETNFSSRGYVSKSNLLLKQLELDATVSLLKNSTDPMSTNELSMLINALLVTCRNPRRFHGFNLVQLLKDQITHSEDTIQPAAYLALCNAHEPLTKSSVDRLLQFLNEDSEYFFELELKAFAIMTISCLLRNGQESSFKEADLETYKSSVAKLKQLQQKDGSFGNSHTTALIMQAIISNEKEFGEWNMRGCVKFLMKQMNSTTDYLSFYYTLPLLNAKSLVDIARVNCKKSGQINEGKNVPKHKSGKKMKVQYSLYLGTNKDVVHNIYLSVPEKSSAYEAMQLAALENPKYKFQSDSISGKIYIYEINGHFNDPEAGLFWFKYIESKRFNHTLVPCKTSADEIELQKNDHLVMWYKKA